MYGINTLICTLPYYNNLFMLYRRSLLCYMTESNIITENGELLWYQRYCHWWHHRLSKIQLSGFQADVIKWKHFPCYWPFVRGIHRSAVNSTHKGQWRGVLIFSLICTWINGWVNNRKAGDLRRYRAHCDVIVMQWRRRFNEPVVSKPASVTKDN